MPGATLDTGALVAIERGSPRMQALLDETAASGLQFAVPAGVVGQAWRASARQARLSRFLGLAQVTVVSLDEPAARAAGVPCGRSDTDDVIDASVVVCARVHGHAVVTSDVRDLGRLDPTLRLIRP